jgi:thioester reductase-like protein
MMAGSAPVGLVPELIAELNTMPEHLVRVLRQVPSDRMSWKPEVWDGSPGETFSALEHVCHVRDIERDGYHVRIRRLLDETGPSLVSLDGYAMASDRRYGEASWTEAAEEFRTARAQTVATIRGLTDPQLARTGTFAEYGELTLRGLLHYLRSHDQQHLACLHWLLGKMG